MRCAYPWLPHTFMNRHGMPSGCNSSCTRSSSSSSRSRWSTRQEAHLLPANGGNVVSDGIRLSRKASFVDAHRLHLGCIADNRPSLPTHPLRGVSDSQFPWLRRTTLNGPKQVGDVLEYVIFLKLCLYYLPSAAGILDKQAVDTRVLPSCLSEIPLWRKCKGPWGVN